MKFCKPKRRDTHCVGCDSSDRRQYLYRLRKKHQDKKCQKSAAEPVAAQKPRGRHISGKSAAQQPQELSPSAIAVAVYFAFGFFGVMMTSTVLGLFTMVLFRPRSWCVYCPMGTMTQGICRLRQKKEDVACGGSSDYEYRFLDHLPRSGLT